MKKNLRGGIYLIFLVLFVGQATWAQVGLPKRSDIKTMRADNYTDDEIRSFIAQAEAAKLSDEELTQYALSQGLPASEVDKFMERVNKLRNNKPNKYNKADNSQRGVRSYKPVEASGNDTLPVVDSLSVQQKMEASLRRRIYGSEIFAGRKITFEPNLRLATPRNYQIGPDDQILIDVSGNSETSMNLTVSPEGTINIPLVGVVPVSGLTIEQATTRIRRRMSTIYSAIRTGDTKLDIALGNVRSIKVILTGEVVAPGTYTLPSVATVVNALYSSGGPTVNGSFREVNLLRGGKKVATLDIYYFLQNGVFKNDIRLQDQDVIQFPVYGKRVEVLGEVKRPRIFELLPGENFANLLEYAGGFTTNAYKERIKVLKTTNTQHRIAEITPDIFDNYLPSNGDQFTVGTLLEKFENRVSVIGAVYRAGDFPLVSGMKVSDLIQKADGLREDAYLERASLIRLKPDRQQEYVALDIAGIVAGRAPDILLQRDDVLEIASKFNLRENFTVQIDGEVQHPGTIAYAEGMTVEDLILRSGNVKESAALNRISIASRKRNEGALTATSEIAEVRYVEVSRDLRSTSADHVLKPFDIVTVYASPGYEIQRVVKIQGEVQLPGTYPLNRKNQRISDILAEAGGPTEQAYLEGASLLRLDHSRRDAIEGNGQDLARQNQEFRELSEVKTSLRADSLSDKQSAIVSAENIVGINLPKILKNKGSVDDIFLEHGDVLIIPKQLQTVAVSGNVLAPRSMIYGKNLGFRDYVSGAGGFSNRARKHSAFVQYANGNVRATKKFLFFVNYPKIQPGSTIFVPAKEEKKSLSAGELTGIVTGLASLGAIILTVISLVNK